jgi:hypothetical protein
MVLDLSDDEAAALAKLLQRTINDDPYPLSPRLAPLKAILARLSPPQPPSDPPPELPGRDPRSAAGRRRQGRAWRLAVRLSRHFFPDNLIAPHDGGR